MRIKDFIDENYVNEIKPELISSKIFIPEVIRSFLTFEELQASFDESLRVRYGQEKMAFRDKMDSIYISLDLLEFLTKNNYWNLIKDRTSFLNFLKEIIDDDFKEYSDDFSVEEKKKYYYDYRLFLKLYTEYINLSV